MKHENKKYDKYKGFVKTKLRSGFKWMDWILFNELFESAYDDGFMKFQKNEKDYDNESHEKNSLKEFVLNDFRDKNRVEKKQPQPIDNEKDFAEDEVEEEMEINIKRFIAIELMKICPLNKNESIEKIIENNASKIFDEVLPLLKRKYWLMNKKVTEKNLPQLIREEKSSFDYPDFYWRDDIIEIVRIKSWTRVD